MKKKGFIIGGICLAAIVGILGYNHEAVRVVFHNVYSPSVKLDDSSKILDITSEHKYKLPYYDGKK